MLISITQVSASVRCTALPHTADVSVRSLQIRTSHKTQPSARLRIAVQPSVHCTCQRYRQCGASLMWLPIRSHAMLLRALPCKARYWGSAARTLAAAVNEPQQPALMRLWADYWPRQATSSANSSFQTTRSICSSTAHSEKLAAENRAEFKEEGPVLQLDAAADEEAGLLSSCFACMAPLSPYSRVEGHPHLTIRIHICARSTK